MLLGKFSLATVAIATSILVTSPPSPTGGGPDRYTYQRTSRPDTIRELRELDAKVRLEKLVREDEEIEAIMTVILRYFYVD